MIFLEPVTFVQFEYMDILLSVVVWQSPFDFGDPLMSSSSNMRSTLLTKARKRHLSVIHILITVHSIYFTLFVCCWVRKVPCKIYYLNTPHVQYILRSSYVISRGSRRKQNRDSHSATTFCRNMLWGKNYSRRLKKLGSVRKCIQHGCW